MRRDLPRDDHSIPPGDDAAARGGLAGWLAARRHRHRAADRRRALEATFDAAVMRVSVWSDRLVDRIEQLREAKNWHERRIFELRREGRRDEDPEVQAEAAASVALAEQMDDLREELAPYQGELERLEDARRGFLERFDEGSAPYEALAAEVAEWVEACRRRVEARQATRRGEGRE